MSPALFLLLAFQDPIALEAVAGASGAKDAPVRFELPKGFDASRPWRLVAADGTEVPVQFAGGAALLLAKGEMEPNSKRSYRLEPAAPSAFPLLEVTEPEGKALVLRAGGRNVLRYNSATVQPPPGMDPGFARNAYVHPIWTPGGRVVSNEFPVHHHLHQCGLWLAWKDTAFEGRKMSFWYPKAGDSKVEFKEVEAKFQGPVSAGFRARHDWTDLKAPGGAKLALRETWDVAAYATDDAFLFDVVSVQACAGESPVTHTKISYGGFAFRGSAAWEGTGTMDFLTSEGKDRKTGNETRARWVVMKGDVGGKPASIGFLAHPSNFRAPEPLRLHPGMPYFCFAPTQQGDFTTEPGRPMTWRYRMVVRDGPLEARELELLWAGFADPPRAAVAK